MTTLASMPYPTARDAALAAHGEPGLSAVLLDGMPLVLDRAAAHDLEADGTTFAYLCWCPWAGRVMTVPVNAGTLRGNRHRVCSPGAPVRA